MKCVWGCEEHGEGVDDDDQEDGGLELHPGPERVDDDHEAVHCDDRQGQGRDVHRHA